MSAWLIHTVLARKLRQDLGNSAAEASGTLGISSKTCVERGKERRTATRAPVAETFNAVANSSSSLPFLSRLRTKTGMAKGNRAHRRRSSCGRLWFKGALKKPDNHAFYRIWGAKSHAMTLLIPGYTHPARGVSLEIGLETLSFADPYFAIASPLGTY